MRPVNDRPINVSNLSPNPSPSNDGNSSAAAVVVIPFRGPGRLAVDRSGDAPQCVKAMAKGTLPATAADFNTCVGWLANHDQQEGLRELLSAPQCSKFDKLDLHGQAMSPAAVHCLALYLDRSSITALNLNGCQLGEEHADDIGKLLHDSPLTMLDLGHNNKLSGAAFSQVCQSLQGNQTLKHLNLQDCGLKADEFFQLLTVLSQKEVRREFVPAHNTTLESLCLADNQLFTESYDDIGGDAFLGGAGWHYGSPEFNEFMDLGNMPGIKWLDLSNTGILLKVAPAGYILTQNSNAALKRLDLANNKCFQHTLEALVSLKGVTHLNLANLKGFTAVSLSTLLNLPSLKVLDLRGVREVFAKGYGAAEADKRLAQILAKNTSLMGVKLDPEIAEDARAQPIINPFASGRPGFKVLVGAAGAFLLEMTKLAVCDADVLVAEALDAKSALSLMSVNKGLAEFSAALREHSNDPGFDWDLAWSGPDGQPEAADDDNSSDMIIDTMTTATTNTTQPTHDREPPSLDPFGAVAQLHANLQANQAADHPFEVQVQQSPAQVPAVSLQVPLDVVLAAVNEGDVAFVKSAVEELEFDVNQTDEQGNVLLLAATRNLNLQMVSTLLELGARDDTGAVLAFARSLNDNATGSDARAAHIVGLLQRPEPIASGEKG